ncbi:NAD(P)/FAD-dependent oxidoreductase [Georgenia faecalis]|uniref:NAD(P)/FAD-dependent oxidoreductase n=1 Tax=Georgenia faecalis TaxID=2483799 RepID=UPI000FDAFA8C|nr:FAD-dependent oxidoreductase [Georgenia faecalis]
MTDARLPRRVLVVGAGLAGLRTAMELRAQGFDGELTVVGAEELPPYDRPPLSKQLLTRAEPVWLSDDLGADLADLADRVLLGRRALGLVAGDDGATVTLDGHEDLSADAVVLACGSAAVRPPALAGALTLHTAADAAALRARLLPGARLVCVGAGWIGAEVAGVAAAAGVRTTVVEMAASPLTRQAGVAGERTRGWYADAGVDLRTGAAAVGTEAGGLRLADGTTLPADVVLAAVGVRPSTAWLAPALPLTARGAVPVDPGGRVRGGPAAVRAVGDCADRTSPRDGLVEGGHWDAALTHPAGVVADLLRTAPPADPAPYVFSTQFGHDVAVVGRPTARSRVVWREDATSWAALHVEDAEDGTARLRAVVAADRHRDVSAARKALSRAAHPVIDLAAATDPAVPLRQVLAEPAAAVRPTPEVHPKV